LIKDQLIMELNQITRKMQLVSKNVHNQLFKDLTQLNI